jgi:hypothetical protein
MLDKSTEKPKGAAAPIEDFPTPHEPIQEDEPGDQTEATYGFDIIEGGASSPNLGLEELANLI